MITVFEVPGTHNLAGNATPAPWAFQNTFDPTKFKWVGADYAGDLYPLELSVNQGVASLQAAMAANPGPYVLIGDSQGAMVTAQCWTQDCVGAVAFGNPRRASGHTFPGCADPGGHGIDGSNLMVNPPAWWWDFAVPGDIITCCPDTTAGTIETAVFDMLMQEYTGNIFNLMWTYGWSAAVAVMQLAYTLLAGHSYVNNATYFPLGDGRTIKQIATDYINSLGA